MAEIFARGQSIQGALRAEKPVPGAAGKSYKRFATERPVFALDDLLSSLDQHGAVVRATPLVQERGPLFNLLMSLAPFLLLILFYRWMFKRQQSAMGGMGGLGGLFGGGQKKKPVDPETVRVTFEDVAGIDEVKAEITEIVDFLRDPEKYRRLGARAPKGVLLTGAPGHRQDAAGAGDRGRGQGPVLLRQRLGVHRDDRGRRGQPRPRAVRRQPARSPRPSSSSTRSTPSAARAAARASIGGHDEREQTLNQILTEMDGFSGHEGVVVLAATNRPDVLDPALLRPGRFDRTIMVHAPDQQGRAAILERPHAQGPARRRRGSRPDRRGHARA